MVHVLHLLQLVRLLRLADLRHVHLQLARSLVHPKHRLAPAQHRLHRLGGGG
jgi:hypothetical protein